MSLAETGLGSLPLVLAIEFKEPLTPNAYFQRQSAQALANQLAFELAKQLETLDGLGLVWMAACYDSAQVLRPNLPIFESLEQLYRAGIRDPLDAPQVMTFQALRGAAPSPELAVDASLLGGPLVLVPLMIVGSAAEIARANDTLEANLLETGLTDARTALMLVEALGAQAEHARLMTLNDLAAMMSMQYAHVGMQSVWSVIEAVVFKRADTEASSIEVGDGLRVRNGQIMLTLQGFEQNQMIDTSAIERLIQQRQMLALLRAHDLVVQLDASGWPAESIDMRSADYFIRFSSPSLLRKRDSNPFVEYRALIDTTHGLIACELFDADSQSIAYAYPLSEAGAQALKNRLADLKRLPARRVPDQ